MADLPLDISHITSTLYVGGHPPPGSLRQPYGIQQSLHPNIGVLVSVAKERPVSSGDHVGLLVYHTPLQDNGPPTPTERQLASLASKFVADQLQKGYVVLVTCLAGINRSAWVAAWALKRQGMTGKEAVRLIRKARGNHVLSNEFFEALVLSDEHPR